ncbi:hypothetical protein EOK75_17715 (plasmid) [Pseudorhodobacter turbinis]|uniref:Uncharacterized protein n=1 Tax=Pseudorhodobacter turbinis TaxID=2500533 RepID=A0A4P8EKJ4_9RHOB|nr:hypothetical protein [Pseudorhodobacter turbinis]QCO57546.1 hypothetical protein EOK75_17715 [Pseudorhodobacter turbinis]
MLEFLPQEIRDGLMAAQKRDQKRRSRLRVHVGDEVIPVLRMWENGLALDADSTINLRGLIDIYDGANHISQCLVIASTTEDGELICDFKRCSHVAQKAALDFVQDETAPVGYLSKN